MRGLNPFSITLIGGRAVHYQGMPSKVRVRIVFIKY